MNDCCNLLESLARQIGKTVTIFTTSGGLSGSGFTGVLASVDECSVRLITDIGAAPGCPVCSSCISPFEGGWGRGGWDGGWGNNWGNNWGGGWGRGGCGGGCGGGNPCGGGNWGSNILGSVTEIPTSSIASFTHNAI